MTNQDEAEGAKTIKEGTIRQTLGNPRPSDPSTEEEVALELARQWDEEDVASPPQRRKGQTRCHKCGHPFDQENLGKYGCPNCHGEGLKKDDR